MTDNRLIAWLRSYAAARTTDTEAVIATGYMSAVAVVYGTVPGLPRFVAAYSLADGAHVIFAYALRGAGDTRFVTLVAIGCAWPNMVLPTYLAWRAGWGLLAAWGFATVYVMVMAAIFSLRFRGGAWRSMRVIAAAGESG